MLVAENAPAAGDDDDDAARVNATPDPGPSVGVGRADVRREGCFD